jgi:ubiquinone/menaquinone biosynthesis C-methylase UbiE
MYDELLTSRFFTTDDKRVDKVVFPLPIHWWSRFYEYAWAAEFCKDSDIVLDAACGIAHPFKFYLAEKCKIVHAIDKDKNINDIAIVRSEVENVFNTKLGFEFIETYDTQIKFKQADITTLPYRNGMFDKVFCISVLEHLPDEEKVKALKEFNRVLKKAGQVILTLDYPDTTMDTIEALANEAGLKLASEKNVLIPANAITWNTQLYCFRMVLIKEKDGE